MVVISAKKYRKKSSCNLSYWIPTTQNHPAKWAIHLYFGRICKQFFIRLQIRQIYVVFVYDWHIIKYSFQPWLDHFIFTFFRLNALLLGFNMHAFVAICHANWRAKSYILHLKRMAIALKFHFSWFMTAILHPSCLLIFYRLKVLKCCFRDIFWLKNSTFFLVKVWFITFQNAVVLQIITHLPIYWCLFSFFCRCHLLYNSINYSNFNKISH